MGVYDRDYYRQERPGWMASGPRSAVGLLIVINVVVYLVDWVFLEGRLSRVFRASVETLTQPWMWWQFLTYGFLHARQPSHIVFNMLGLFFLGRDIEEVYGTKEFLRLYLAMIVFGGMLWAAGERLRGDHAMVVGASGAIAGIVVLYALNFPRRMLLLFFVLPVPAWFAGVLLVAFDAFGAIRQTDSQVAFVVHLGGAGLALLYYFGGWNFGRWWSRLPSWPRMRRRPKFRVRAPDADEEQDLNDEVDRILGKISREGEASLTPKERRTLETASRQYQKRRHGPGDRV